PIEMFSTGKKYEVKETGVFTPKQTPRSHLVTGDVGYLIANMKSSTEVKIGDTITDSQRPCSEPLPGFKEIQPMVFAGIYPVSSDDFEQLKVAMGKLQINDAAFTYQAESSAALGFGFRCGFLGLLHMEIVRERLEREFNLDLISTAPNVVYHVTMEDGAEHEVTNPSEYPTGKIHEVREPVVKATILTPADYIGTIMELCQAKRGALDGMDYLSEDRVEMRYTLPLAEIVFDFFD
ncbi:MAG: elongation factor 4, partial [Verrucomicrobiae bacterium]|nr:elongation factor 4 [Verrucomicrobiae bacterium]